MYYALWKKDEILDFVRKMGVHSIKDPDDYKKTNNNIKVFIKLSTTFHVIIIFGLLTLAVTSTPIFSSERRLPLNVFIPFDSRNNLILYWIAFA